MIIKSTLTFSSPLHPSSTTSPISSTLPPSMPIFMPQVCRYNHGSCAAPPSVPEDLTPAITSRHVNYPYHLDPHSVTPLYSQHLPEHLPPQACYPCLECADAAACALTLLLNLRAHTCISRADHITQSMPLQVHVLVLGEVHLYLLAVMFPQLSGYCNPST